MSKSIKYANSVTDIIMKSPFLLQSITTTLSKVPATTSFGIASGGVDRVSVKNRSENGDCMHCSVAESADLPDVAMDLVIPEVKKTTAIFLIYYTIHVKI